MYQEKVKGDNVSRGNPLETLPNKKKSAPPIRTCLGSWIYSLKKAWSSYIFWAISTIWHSTAAVWVLGRKGSKYQIPCYRAYSTMVSYIITRPYCVHTVMMWLESCSVWLKRFLLFVFVQSLFKNIHVISGIGLCRFHGWYSVGRHSQSKGYMKNNWLFFIISTYKPPSVVSSHSRDENDNYFITILLLIIYPCPLVIILILLFTTYLLI